MKELSIEQKAKAYDKVVEKAKMEKEKSRNLGLLEFIDENFPELKDESDDERIRKELISFFTERAKYTEDSTFNGLSSKEIIAWLEAQGEHANFINKIQIGDKVTRNEDGVLVNLSQLNRVAKKDEKQGKNNMGISEAIKQKLEDNLNKALEKETPESWNEFLDEQKPADKVEPKFKVGDWVVSEITGFVYQIKNYIENLSNHKYWYDFINGDYICSDEVNRYHLWTIQDAKAGDVLSWDDSKCIAIFKNIYDEESFNSYGFVGGCTGTFESRMSYHDIEGAHPATKEQRDLLEKAMADAGYTFDFEKKELKKIEQKTAWSEEDEKIYSRIYDLIHAAAFENCDVDDTGNELGEYAEMTSLLKSLKDRVQPQANYECSEEDERRIEECAREAEDCNYIILAKHIRQLKSLRPQLQWKPSDEQMDALHYVTNFDYGGHKATLVSLYEQLKKLREKVV